MHTMVELQGLNHLFHLINDKKIRYASPNEQAESNQINKHIYLPCHCRNDAAVWHVHKGVFDAHHLEQSELKREERTKTHKKNT